MKDTTKPGELIEEDTDNCLFHMHEFSGSLDLKKLVGLVSAA